MKVDNTSNIYVRSEQVLISPDELKQVLPASEQVLASVEQARQTISEIIHRRDKRLLVISGPCSIHDEDAALEYAKQLNALRLKYADSLYIVMRVYFEKPRTTVGWKGFINDPHMDGSFDLETGLRKARTLLLKIAEMGLPMATEALDPISPQYMAELFSWSAIGARTTESQTHREMASGLSMPVGFKNGTDGNLDTAINALKAAASSHAFMGINMQGQVAIITTQGNPDGHVILRGGSRPNYDSVSVAECEEKLEKAGMQPALIIDCSHANSNKDYRRQSLVADDVMLQISAGNQSIIGLMLESNLRAGNQSFSHDLNALDYGVSITDACIDWDTTASLLEKLDAKLSTLLLNR